MGYPGYMKRLNPETGLPFVSGDVREDGFVFRRYNLSRKRPNGEFLEQWYSPANFARGQARERSYMAKRGADLRKVVQDYKVEKGCADCGYNQHPAALDFDHLPGTEKLFNVSGRVARSPEVVFAEMEKREVVCANCHRIRTFLRGTNFTADGTPAPSFAQMARAS